MNVRRCILGGLAVVVWLCSQPLRAAVATADNPYMPIADRNVFGLVPIPPPAAAVDPATLNPPPKITPNGIMTLFGKLQVLFKVAGVAKPGQPPKDESYVMCEGDRQDDIEVQRIDQGSATITFNNHGVIQVLPLVASTGGTSAPAAPAGGAIPPPPMPTPGNGVGTLNHFGGHFGHGRGVTTGGNPDAGAPPPAASPSATTAPAQEPLTPEAQIIMIEANRMLTQDAVTKGDMPPLPPTELTPPEATGIGGAPLVVDPAAPAAGGGVPSAQGQ
jgi:hypothetical protein